MNDRKLQIGFSQRVRLEWFERAANLILAGSDKATINDALQDLLQNKVSIGGKAVRGNREKVITILLKTWLTVPSELRILRDEGLDILQKLPEEKRIVVHWGMAMAAYPFWGAVASHVGRLLRLQGTASAFHVQRRVKEEYGERETAARAARRVLRSFIDWRVLNETGNKGIYSAGNQYSVDDPRLIAWVLEASLHARANGSAPMRDLLESPTVFPFQLSHPSRDQIASFSPRLEVLRHGLDADLLILSTSKSGRK